jgi:uncharacterized membrane protein YozB (DUF420 family)
VTSILPHFTVSFNALSTVLLLLGYRAVRRRDILLHKRLMICALASSTLFLITYLAHKAADGTVRYPYDDWTRPVYLVILLPHVLLAMLMGPFILRGAWLAATGRFMQHARLMRRVFPVWLYVSVTGVLVYLFLYAQPHFR